MTSDYSIGDEVALACPLCEWESGRFVLGGTPNAVWHCYQRLGPSYRQHFDIHHRPLARRLHFPAHRDDSEFIARDAAS